ncbi:MAG: WYL domain-containing protein [Anaeromyxobacter sp.]
MRATRLLSLLVLLQLRVRATAEELARELGVSVRTLYRDVAALEAAGIPIAADRGPGGGFQLVAGYRTRLTGLAAEEAEAVFMIGLPGAAGALGLGPAAVRAGRKVLAALPAELSAGAARIAARFHVDPVDWYRAVEPSPHLPALARAVLDARVVAMEYRSWTSTRRRRVEPLGLVQKAGGFYLVARRPGGEPRIYRAASIGALEVEDARFTPPRGFDLAAFWREGVARFEAGLLRGVARVRATAAGRERLARVAHAARAVREAPAPGPDGRAEFALPYETEEQAALALLGCGPEVEVLEPPALRARVRALAREVTRRTRP